MVDGNQELFITPAINCGDGQQQQQQRAGGAGGGRGEHGLV